MKVSRLIFLIAAVALFASMPAHAQFDLFGDDSSTPPPPWTQFKLNPNTRVTLDFRNASVDAVLHVMSQASGIAIIKDPSLTGGITLQSPKPQTLNDAFSMLSAVLGLKNYEIDKQDNFLLIKAKPAPSSRFGGFGGGTGGTGGVSGYGGGRSAQQVLRVYPIKYANATNLAKTINDVFAQTAATQAQNANPFAAFALGGGGNNNNAAAGNAGNAGGNGGGGFGGGGRRGGGGSSANAPPVKASADDFSNSLVINATSDQQDQIAEIISQIDKPSDQPQQPRVFHLEYALASDLQPVIQNFLSSTSPVGRGSTTTNAPRASPFGGGGGGGGGPGGFFARIAQATSGQTGAGVVSADTRTNSLIVTSTEIYLDQVAKIVTQLDTPSTYASSTFVYVMKNARADVVANLLNQSFGNRTTNGPVGGSLTNTGLSQASVSSSSSSPGSLNTTGARTSAQNNNFTVTSSTQNQTMPTTGLDADGHIVNIRNLTGNVLLVPNIDTNSIIVVAPPEDKAVVESVLEEMDQTPEQVMIETLIVEANLTKSDSLGVEYNFMQTNPLGGVHGTITGTQSFGNQANTTQPQGLRLTLTAAQYSVFLNAIQTDTKFDVLSTPRIFTTNNATAQINISQSLPYVTNQTVDTTGTIVSSYNFLDVGIVLTVTPRIMSDGAVTMDVSQTANDFVNYTSFDAPIVNQRETQTTVTVNDGETVVLGGIINNQVNDTTNKIPLLGDLPLVGNLFRSNTKTNQKTELLVFMTPHVIHDAADAEKIKEATESELGKSTQSMIPSAAPAPKGK